MPVNIDMTGVSTASKTFEAGDYEFVITKAEIRNSKSSGNPTVYVTYAINKDPKNALEESYSLQPDALWKLKTALVELGYEIPDGRFEFDEGDLVGVEGIARLVKEPYKNYFVNRVETLNPSDVSTTTPEAVAVDERKHAGDSTNGQFDWDK